VWTAAQLEPDTRWQHEFDAEKVDVLDSALNVAVRRGASIETLSNDSFPLTGLEGWLQGIAEELERGCGIVRLRGLPVERYTEAECALLFMGLCRTLGTPVFQNSGGQLLRQIRNEGPDVGLRYGQLGEGDQTFLSSRARTASTAPLRFHTDRTDVVALLCVNQAARGGLSKIASTAAVHNAMLNEHPQLLELLFQSYHRSRLGEEEGGESQVYALPVFGLADGHFTSHYSRTYIEAAQLIPDVPKMSAQQWRALDVLAETAERLCMSMRLEPGDIQLLNNHVVYHSRSAFENDVSRNLERVLLRVWLCMPNNRPLPVDHEVLWRNTDAGSMRGGIMPASLG